MSYSKITYIKTNCQEILRDGTNVLIFF